MIKLVNKDSGKNLDQYQMSEEIASGKYWTTIDCAENGGSVDLSKAVDLRIHAEGAEAEKAMEVINPFIEK